MKLPKVSVLIPTYNYAKFLGEAIESVLHQSFQDFELIIVDNNSQDNTADVVKKYSSDKRISYYRNEHNIGMVPNFNKCLGYAKGEYIKFLLADDKLHPEQLLKFVGILDKYPNVSIVSSFSESFGTVREVRSAPLEHLQSAETVIREVLRDGKGNFLGEPTTVMFRSANLSVGDFNAEYTCLIDLDYWLRHLTLGDCYIIPEVLSYFRVHDEQASSGSNYNNWFDEYHFYERTKKVNRYMVNLEKLNIDRTIKKTALKSASVMYLVLPKIGKSKNRLLFANAFKIAWKEGVLLSSLFIALKRKRKKKLADSSLATMS